MIILLYVFGYFLIGSILYGIISSHSSVDKDGSFGCFTVFAWPIVGAIIIGVGIGTYIKRLFE